jgi:hypothetical protein
VLPKPNAVRRSGGRLSLAERLQILLLQIAICLQKRAMGDHRWGMARVHDAASQGRFR